MLLIKLTVNGNWNRHYPLFIALLILRNVNEH